MQARELSEEPLLPEDRSGEARDLLATFGTRDGLEGKQGGPERGARPAPRRCERDLELLEQVVEDADAPEGRLRGPELVQAEAVDPEGVLEFLEEGLRIGRPLSGGA